MAKNKTKQKRQLAPVRFQPLRLSYLLQFVVCHRFASSLLDLRIFSNLWLVERNIITDVTRIALNLFKYDLLSYKLLNGAFSERQCSVWIDIQ